MGERAVVALQPSSEPGDAKAPRRLEERMNQPSNHGQREVELLNIRHIVAAIKGAPDDRPHTVIARHFYVIAISDPYKDVRLWLEACGEGGARELCSDGSKNKNDCTLIM